LDKGKRINAKLMKAKGWLTHGDTRRMGEQRGRAEDGVDYPKAE